MQYDANISSPFRWPSAFAGQPLFYEWSRDYAKVMQLNRPNGNQLADIQHLFGGAPSQNPNIVLDNPMDMEFGPDNALYVLEYGTGYFAELPAAQLAAHRLRAQRPVHAGRARRRRRRPPGRPRR